MTPQEREQDIVAQIDDLTEDALDAAERDLQNDLFRCAYELELLIVQAEGMKARGERIRPDSETLKLLDSNADRLGFMLD